MAKMTAQKLIDTLRAQQAKGPAPDWETARAGMEQQSAKAPLPEGTAVQTVDAGGVPAELVSRPGSAQDRHVLYLHGGGYTMGSAATHRALAAHLAGAAQAKVLVLDYRLAPECPFPAALDDALAAWRWLGDQPGFRAERAAIAGDSAGGGLAAAIVLALKELDEPLPAAAALLSPWVDATASGDSHRSKVAEDPSVTPDMLARCRDAYLTAEVDPTDPRVSPLFGDWRGAPPMLVTVGSTEILLDDARQLVDRAEAAGVAAKLEQWPDMVHVFQLFAGLIDEADQSIAGIGEFIRNQTS